MSDLAELQGRLESNPIYALSLGSRELFHSNFLGWIFERYEPMIAAIYDERVSGKITIEREKHNFDLIVKFGDPEKRQSIIIEVKVKDAPRLKQLLDYDRKIVEESEKGNLESKPHRILLSLVPAPEQLRTESGWHFLILPLSARKSWRFPQDVKFPPITNP